MNNILIKEISRVSIVAMIVAALIVYTGSTEADQIRLNVALGKPVLAAGQTNNTYLKVGLTGFELSNNEERPPVNVAIVLDKSSSMSGQKIIQARAAAVQAIRSLTPNDIVSVIAYSDTVEVVVPATKLQDPEALIARINSIQAGGCTALFAGVSKGAAELRKFKKPGIINRIVLLSDGQANVGPSNPSELGELGATFIREGISVSTLGLGTGYNEDLMTRLALRSDGNHAFVRTAEELPRFFALEFGVGLSVVAQEVMVKINCEEGVRPIRILGREGEIRGQTVTVPINQLYAKQERYVVLEVAVAPGVDGSSRSIATVDVSYANMKTGTTDRLASSMAARFTHSEEVVRKELNHEVMVAVVTQVANDTNRRAMVMRDDGKIAAAKKMLQVNAAYLKKKAVEYASEQLDKVSADNYDDAEAVQDASKYNKRRKDMQARQSNENNQMAY